MSGEIDFPVAYSPSWWASRTGEQLQDLIRSGLMGGDAFLGAQCELERRARDAAQQRDRVAEAHRQDIGEEDRSALTAAIFCLLAAVAALFWLVTAD